MAATDHPPDIIVAPAAKQRRSAIGAALEEAGEITAFAGLTIAGLRRVPRYTSEVLRQAAILVRGSTFVIFVMCLFIGMEFVNFAYFFLRAAGASDYTGMVSGIAVPRAIMPIMFGYVFAGKVGCGLAAEVGSMRINEEIDAYEITGASPVSYVVGTRIAGTVIFLPVAIAVALFGADQGCLLQAVPILHSTSPGAFLHYHWSAQNLSDNLLAGVDCASQAIFIVIVSCFYGYRAEGGPAAVGSAVARSLLVNIVMVNVLVSFWVCLFYGLNPHIPIGG